MKREALRSLALVGALAVALAVGGCTKKQIRQEGDVAAPEGEKVETVTPPTARAPIRETPIETRRPTEPPPPQTAAQAPAPEAPLRAKELRHETTSGLQRIHFDFDAHVLTPKAQEILKVNAAYLNRNPGTQIRIEGHCDERGTTEYNLALGERRARAAFQYLMDLGVDPNRMAVVSYGEEVPLEQGHTEEAWAANRRAEFVEIQR